MLDYMEFVFKRRASSFMHHTPERVVELIFKLFNSPSSNNLIDDFFGRLDGDTGLFSESDLMNLKYTTAAGSYLLTEHCIENHVNAELAYATSDYFIYRIDQTKTYAEAMEVFNNIAKHYRDLLWHQPKTTYAYPISRCVHYIEQNLYTDLRAKQVAAYMKLTPQYLTVLFKQHTGKNVYQFILDKKIDEAKRVLEFTSFSILEVANSLGFHSIAHFSKSFKGRTGETPTQYRINHSRKVTLAKAQQIGQSQ